MLALGGLLTADKSQIRPFGDQRDYERSLLARWSPVFLSNQLQETETMAKQNSTNPNLPSVSKQTAGGVTGAVLGGIVGGPIGALVGGVAGAAVGNASAKGKEPIKKTVEKIRSMGKGRLAKAAAKSIGPSATNKNGAKGTSKRAAKSKSVKSKAKSK
jgi:predicted lipid-binding transport protein (Tim44 family)